MARKNKDPNKSYVSMENKVCPACGKQHNHDCGILIDKRLKDSMSRTTVTSFGLCEEHAKLCEQGYIHLVAIDESKSEISADGTIKPQDAYRTGEIIHMKREVFHNFFGDSPIQEVVFVDKNIINFLENVLKKTKKEEKDE
jgi:hypothetical protein